MAERYANVLEAGREWSPVSLQNMILHSHITRWLKCIETLFKFAALALASCLFVVLWNLLIAHSGYDFIPYIMAGMWILAGVLLVLTALELLIIGPIRSAVVRSRRRHKCCVSCGYHLKGARLSQGALICPECGWRDNDSVRLYFSRVSEV